MSLYDGKVILVARVWEKEDALTRKCRVGAICWRAKRRALTGEFEV